MRDAYASTDLPQRLARHHGGITERMFRGWNDVWLLPEFRSWNIEECLPGIECPVLLIQGEDDEYGTLKQLDAVERQVCGPVERLVLPECGTRRTAISPRPSWRPPRSSSGARWRLPPTGRV